MNQNNPVDSTYKRLLDAKKRLNSLTQEHAAVFGQFAELVDHYNEARSAHLQALKTEKTASPLFRMSIPRKFICPDVKAAMEVLGARFAEFFAIEYKPRTPVIRNAIDSGTAPGIEMVILEIEDSPRHTGPKEIDLSALGVR